MERMNPATVTRAPGSSASADALATTADGSSRARRMVTDSRAASVATRHAPSPSPPPPPPRLPFAPRSSRGASPSRRKSPAASSLANLARVTGWTGLSLSGTPGGTSPCTRTHPLSARTTSCPGPPMFAVRKSTSAFGLPSISSTSASSTYARTTSRESEPWYTPAQMVEPSSSEVFPCRVVATGTRSMRASWRTAAWHERRCTSTPTRIAGRCAPARRRAASVAAAAHAVSSCAGAKSHEDAGCASSRSAAPGHSAAATSIGTSRKTGIESRTQRRSVSSIVSAATDASKRISDATVTCVYAVCCAYRFPISPWCGKTSAVGL
mmetsp:Transcript_13426/g.34978  ORF Transcript_13426/g.34978 Transcript_13426/m.34978 type:complete len:324 (-) Transcript_13426:410-1381(-)